MNRQDAKDAKICIGRAVNRLKRHGVEDNQRRRLAEGSRQGHEYRGFSEKHRNE